MKGSVLEEDSSNVTAVHRSSEARGNSDHTELRKTSRRCGYFDNFLLCAKDTDRHFPINIIVPFFLQ